MPPSRTRGLSRAAGVAVAVVVAVPLATSAFWLAIDGGGRLGLWHVIDKLCRPAHRWLGTPFPCLEVSSSGGYAVVHAPFDGTEILVVPLAPIRGVEDPAIRRATAPDLWSVAWRERGRVGQRLGRPLADDAIALAINSRSSRTQDQYHVHVDCMAGAVRRSLRDAAGPIDDHWRELRPAPWGASYRVRRIDLATLARERPERLIDREIGPASTALEDLSFAVLGRPGGSDADPALVLAVTFGRGSEEGGHAEELMDHACRANQAPG